MADARKLAFLGFAPTVAGLCLATLGFICIEGDLGVGPFTGETICPDQIISTDPTLSGDASPPGTVASAAGVVDGTASPSGTVADAVGTISGATSGSSTGSSSGGGSTGGTCT